MLIFSREAPRYSGYIINGFLNRRICGVRKYFGQIPYNVSFLHRNRPSSRRCRSKLNALLLVLAGSSKGRVLRIDWLSSLTIMMITFAQNT